MDVRTIHESTVLALEGKVAIPQIIDTLGGLGIERYYADFIRMEKVFYDRNDQSCLERMPLPALPEVAHAFDPMKIMDTLRAMQDGKVDYPDFIRSLMDAGVASLSIYVEGRLAVFSGRRGESHIERIPTQKAS